MIRTGIGYDSHRFEAGRPLILGGVTIPHSMGLAGHSDADAVAHAVTDAILGAAAAGSIGHHFPDSDPRWKGADSRTFLRHCDALLREKGWRVGNADVTVVCERPKIGPHAGAMRALVAQDLGIGVDDVGIKATTTDRLGFTGRGEGLAAQAVALLRRRGA